MNKKNSFFSFLNGKGFYVALALCLVGAGTAAWAVVDRTLGSITAPANPPEASSAASEPSQVHEEVSQVEEEPAWSFPELEEAEKPQQNVAVESSSSSSESTASSSSSSSGPQSDAGEVSAPQELPLDAQISAFVPPISSAEVFNQYSNGELVKNTTLDKWCTHDGVDFSATEGTAVLCVADGTVSRVYDNGIWGRTVEVTHNGDLVSIYSGLSRDTDVVQGDAVTIGQTLGKVGDTNLAEAKLESHLHFAMKQAGSYVDPLVAMGMR